MILVSTIKVVLFERSSSFFRFDCCFSTSMVSSRLATVVVSSLLIEFGVLNISSVMLFFS